MSLKKNSAPQGALSPFSMTPNFKHTRMLSSPKAGACQKGYRDDLVDRPRDKDFSGRGCRGTSLIRDSAGYRGTSLIKNSWESYLARKKRGDRGTSLIRNSAPLEPYSRNMPRALWWSQGGGTVSYERGTPAGVLRARGLSCPPQGTNQNSRPRPLALHSVSLRILNRPGGNPVANGWFT